MADVDTRPRRATCSPRTPAKQKMYRTITAKVRLAPPEAKQWRTAAGKGTLSAFIRQCVEAALVGKIDHATLNEQLLAIRRAINAAAEAATVEEAREILSVAKLHINALRGH
jgi:hypothetical protein